MSVLARVDQSRLYVSLDSGATWIPWNGVGGAGSATVNFADGVSASILATVKDYTNSNPLAVITVDTNGDPVSASGGGTQYTEDAPAAANPVGTALNLVRLDTLAALVSADGDNVAARGTNKGEVYVKHVDSISASLGVDQVVAEGGTPTVQAYSVQGIASGVPVSVGLDALSVGYLSTIDASTGTISTAIYQEDSPGNFNALNGMAVHAVRQDTPATTSGADGDFEFIKMSSGRLWTSSKVDNASGASAVNIQDGGNSITIDATNLDVALSTRLKPADTLTGLTTLGTITNVVHVDDNAGSLTIDNTNLDATISSRLKPADTLTGVTTVGTITNVVHIDDNAGSLTVDGAVTVSGSVTANAGTNLNTSALALEATQLTGNASLVSLVAKDFATSAKQDTSNVSLASIDAKNPALIIDSAGISRVPVTIEAIGRVNQELLLLEAMEVSFRTLMSSESATSQRMGFEVR